MQSNRLPALAAATFFSFSALSAPAGVQAAVTPADKCESGMNSLSGKYAACLFKAQQKFVKGGSTDTAGRSEAIAACAESYDTKWATLEEKGEGSCPTSADGTSMREFLDACVLAGQDSLGGETLPLDVEVCNADLASCNATLDELSSRIILFDAGVSLPGNLGDRATTTAMCASAKPQYLYCPHGVIAMLSYSGGDSVANMPDNYANFPSDVPVLAGAALKQLASDWADFSDGGWSACLAATCSSAATPANLYPAHPQNFYTGTTNTGATSADNCSDWSQNTEFGGTYGQNLGTAFSSGGMHCSIPLPFACLCY